MLRQADVVDALRELDARYDLTLVEGAGGILVRLGEDGFTLLDVARDLDAPVVVVAAAQLGTLNHSALTVQALAAGGARCVGVVIGSWPVQPDLAQCCNLEDLSSVTGVDLVGKVPADSGYLTKSEFCRAAPHWFGEHWLTRVR